MNFLYLLLAAPAEAAAMPAITSQQTKPNTNRAHIKIDELSVHYSLWAKSMNY